MQEFSNLEAAMNLLESEMDSVSANLFMNPSDQLVDLSDDAPSSQVLDLDIEDSPISLHLQSIMDGSSQSSDDILEVAHSLDSFHSNTEESDYQPAPVSTKWQFIYEYIQNCIDLFETVKLFSTR